jgi:hypothetical protein
MHVLKNGSNHVTPFFSSLVVARPVFTHGAQGGILKKFEIEVWYVEKKKAVHEREI